jgi:hypothetical protein
MTKLYLCLFWLKNRDASQQQAWDARGPWLSPASALALLLSAVAPPLLGMLPDLFARPLAEQAMPFLRGASLPESIAWFSAENLRGAAISLGIGAAVCWLIHRFLVRGGAYLNRWPAWLDLENSFYRPLVSRWLPALGMAVARCFDHALENPLFLRLLPRAAAAAARGLNAAVENRLLLRGLPALVFWVTRALELAADSLVLRLRHSLFHSGRIRDPELSASEKADLAVGEAWNHLSPRRDHVALLVAAKKEAEKAEHYLSRSVSFGLLLLALGLLCTLIYLLIVFRPAA